MIHRTLLAFVLALFSFAAWAFEAGKNYEVIEGATPQAGQSVIEFFSYGCPACYQFEPSIEKWLAKKPKNVTFERVPVVFNPSWETYAKAYYTAESLGITQKIHLALFQAIHDKNRPLTTDEAMKAFFVEQGIPEKEVVNTYDFTPGMVPRLHHGQELLMQYQIHAVPAVVVNGRYRVVRSMTKSDAEFTQVIDFLLKKG